MVPQCLQTEILNELHAGAAGAHLGEEKTLSQLKQRFYWPGHYNAVRNWCKTCATCATRKIVAVDILGPLVESTAGNSYVLVAADYFTRWTEAYTIPNQEATTVADKLLNEMFLQFSPPEQLHSDQGRQFESDLISSLCKLLHINKSRTTPYHPQGDGLVERFNRTLLDMLATSVQDHPFDWESHLRKVCMAYNTSVHSTTGYTPFFFMFGREARLPVDLMYGTGNQEDQPVSEYVCQMKESLVEAYGRVREKTQASQKRQKEFYDQRVHGEPHTPGDLVWLHSTVIPQGQCKKFHHPWIGPFKIVKQTSQATYRIQGLHGKRVRKIVHFDRLKPCTPGTRFANDTPLTTDPHIQDALELPIRSYGDHLELVESDDRPAPPQRRYPLRDRRLLQIIEMRPDGMSS